MEPVRHALNFFVILLEVVLIFNLLIVVHELGHFLAARWRGLIIEKFGIWFGKPLWKKTINGVQYSLGSIPFGGFVALPQMAPMDAAEGTPLHDRASLPTVGPLDKIIVALAGPVFSFGLALVFAWMVYLVGNPVRQAETTRTIGFVEPGSPAAKAECTQPGVPAGLRPGDVIERVDGHSVTRFIGMLKSVVWYVARSEGETIPFDVLRDGQMLTFQPRPLVQEGSGWRRKALRQVFIEPAYDSIVSKIKPGSPADKAGLQDRDIVTAVNGSKIYNPQGIIQAEQENYGKTVQLTVQRDGKMLQLPLAIAPFKASEVFEDSPAARAGIKKNDTILAINSIPLTRFSEIRAAIEQNPGQALKLTVADQDGQQREVNVTPLVPKSTDDPTAKKEPMLGVGQSFDADGISWVEGGKMDIAHEEPWDQIRGSVTSIVNTIGAVVAPHSSIKLQHLGGPVFIGRTYFALLSSEQGWRLALWFSVILNVNLAMLNLLPIPVLDGGHILLALIESVRRKPVNIRVLEVVQTGCFVVIAGYMLFVTFFDVGDLLGGHRHRNDLEFPSPTPAAKP